MSPLTAETSTALLESDPTWDRAAQEHRESLAAFLDSAAAVDLASWTRPVGPGKWTPGQISEHLSLAYEAVLTELAGGPPMALRVTGWRQRLLRAVLLPHILFHRSFPIRAISPRECRPPEAEALPDRDAALDRLRALGTTFEHEMKVAATSGIREFCHPYFGPIPLVRGLRFCSVHLDHHRLHIEAVR